MKSSVMILLALAAAAAAVGIVNGFGVSVSDNADQMADLAAAALGLEDELDELQERLGEGREKVCDFSEQIQKFERVLDPLGGLVPPLGAFLKMVDSLQTVCGVVDERDNKATISLDGSTCRCRPVKN